MTSFDRFERSLPSLFDELAAAPVPDYTDDLLARTAATRQRPKWAFLERWLPVSSFAARLAPSPRIPWRLGALVALVAVAALIAVMVAGALLRPPSTIELACTTRGTAMAAQARSSTAVPRSLLDT